jgi:hypothetical protein
VTACGEHRPLNHRALPGWHPHQGEREIWHELCDLWDAPPGSIAHAQAQIDTTREQVLNDAEHIALQDDSQIPDDVEALLNEIARELDALEGGPPDPLGWITPEHQAAMAALAEHALADPWAARLRARRENETGRPADLEPGHGRYRCRR